MISRAEALKACLALVDRAIPTETVPLSAAGGRVLAQPFDALHDQPPFAASAMDGYAVRDATPGARYRVVGEAAAGHGWAGTLGQGKALRIFTGAPVPEGATQVVIQEDVTRDGDEITLKENLDPGPHIRPAGGDFRKADRSCHVATRLTPAHIALAAAMGHGSLTVARRPDVAIMATGDELVPPGDAPGPDQIVASNVYGLKAMAEAAGATARLMPIARDTKDSLSACFALAADADLIVTVGGASVGDHDLVGAVAASLGMERAFYKIAMRPGKPLMAGRMGDAILLGLPGNPVSALVCGQLFMVPMIRSLLGLAPDPLPLRRAPLAVDVPANGPREHFMRAALHPEGLRPVDNQDSSLLTRLATADVLLVRPPHDPARVKGDMMHYTDIIA